MLPKTLLTYGLGTALSVSLVTAARAETSIADDVKFDWSTYGAVNLRQFEYFKNAQDTAPRTRRQTDLERLVFEPVLSFGKEWKLETEIEFEHGGTGSTLEFDGFSEFGEFESEVEQGGEVRVEKFELKRIVDPDLNFRFGYITVPVGTISQRHHPTEYFTATRNRSEQKVLPSTWRSVGFGVTGRFLETWEYQFVVVQGLNSEFFRKYNWIQGGAKRAFESTYIDDVAGALRLDWGSNKPYQKIGASFYYGNTSRNRMKTDKLSVDAGVMIADVHANWESETWTMRALYLRGYLQNSEDVSNANATLGGAANPGAFSALGKSAEVGFAEIGYNLQSAFPTMISERTDFYVRYDMVDPMKETTGTIYSDPRYRETSWSTGLSYKPRSELVAKLQLSRIQSGFDAIPIQTEILAGFGFYYSTED